MNVVAIIIQVKMLTVLNHTSGTMLF